MGKVIPFRSACFGHGEPPAHLLAWAQHVARAKGVPVMGKVVAYALACQLAPATGSRFTVTVAELRGIIGNASEDSIRRGLKGLCGKGLLTRCGGGFVAVDVVEGGVRHG